MKWIACRITDMMYFSLVQMFRVGRVLYGKPAFNHMIADAKGDARLY